jgi:hypothetical protein
MKPTSAFTLIAATLVALGAAYWIHAREPRRVWPKPTPPPPASSIYHDVREAMPSEADIEREAREHPARLEEAIQDAVNSRDSQWREAAFVFLLPELLQVEPQRLIELVARQKPGPGRDLLRTELSQYWIDRDAPAAMAWMRSLDESERRASALTALNTIAPVNPLQAIAIALEFDVGLRDGTIERLVQVWAADDPPAVRRWLDTQPREPRMDSVRERVRADIARAE